MSISGCLLLCVIIIPFVDKQKNEIGGVDYMYPEMVENFSQYAQTSLL